MLMLYRNNKLKKQHADTSQVFANIYHNNRWKSEESVSGIGSEIRQTEVLVNKLSQLLKELQIESVLDIPCGDFNWMQRVDLKNVKYTGADIVEELINKNIEKYGKTNNIEFRTLNLITDPLPRSNMIIIRDCLVHLSYKEIFSAIKNIKSSGSDFLLTTTFPEHHKNYDIPTGKWRPLNMQDKPFNFPRPIIVINEKCTEGNGKYKDKSMALWRISDL